jgi:hypothetical protein
MPEYSWEYFFNEEALKVEEVLSSGDNVDFEKSRLRIAFEKNILNWFSYKQWFLSHYHVPALRDDLGPSDVIHLNSVYNKNRSYFNQYNIFNDDLIPLQIWDNKPIILGLNYNEKIKQIPDAIFILCSPKVLSQITDANYSTEAINTSWSEMDSNHDEYTELARKNFDAFVVLKIKDNQTELFKMDEDLRKENIDAQAFQYSLKQTNAFSAAFQSEQSQLLDLTDAPIKVLDYTFAAITPLKRGNNVVGFLVGLKTSKMSAEDTVALERISERAAS